MLVFFFLFCCWSPPKRGPFRDSPPLAPGHREREYSESRTGRLVTRKKRKLEIPNHAMAFEDIPKKDWYSILGAEPCDSLKELKRKYQRLILLYHPDKQSTDVPAGEAEARMQRFIEIDRAWKILGNEETKKEYDLQRHEYELEQGCPVDTQISLEDMTWNHNDHCYSFTCRCGGKYTVSKNEVEDVSLVSCDTCSLVIEII